MTQVLNKSIFEIVEDNFHTAAVFEKYGISFCDDEKENTLKDVCLERNLDSIKIAEELFQVSTARLISHNLPFSKWKLDFLIDYIKHIHHDYAAIILPQMESTVVYLMQHCEEKHPFLSPLNKSIERLKLSISVHNLREEEIIFPYIRQLENLAEKNDGFGQLFVRTLRKPLEAIIKGHDIIQSAMSEIRELTNNYSAPESACPKLRVLLKQLKELQCDILEHNYLENKILFPRALDIEKSLLTEQTE